MINFLRRIRRDLINENKTSIYLIYAIGEVVLVVFGILIALQIDNWNENNKTRKLEIKTLIELRTDLIQNHNEIELHINSLEVCKMANEIIIYHIENNLPYNDSLDFHFANLYPYITSLPVQTTFDRLKQSGIELISNDSLRSNISVLFANQFKAFQTFETTYFVEHYTNYIKPMFMTEFETFEVFRSIKPKWYEQFVNNKNYKQIMNYTITNCIMFIQYQTGLKEIAEAIYNKQYNTIANAKPAPSPAPALIGRLSSDSQFRQGSGAAGIRTGAPTQRLLKPLCVIV